MSKGWVACIYRENGGILRGKKSDYNKIRDKRLQPESSVINSARSLYLLSFLLRIREAQCLTGTSSGTLSFTVLQRSPEEGRKGGRWLPRCPVGKGTSAAVESGTRWGQGLWDGP